MSFSVLGKSKMEIDSVVSSSTPLPQAACLENSSGKTRGRGRGVSVEAASLLLCARFLQDLTGSPLKQFLLFLFFLLLANVRSSVSLLDSEIQAAGVRPQSGHFQLQSPSVASLCFRIASRFFTVTTGPIWSTCHSPSSLSPTQVASLCFSNAHILSTISVLPLL